MFGIENFSLFLISCILLNLTPGQDTMYIIGRSVAQGKMAGIYSAFGIMCGVLIHTMLAALGLSAVLATSSLMFSIVKYAGAGYLIWIGVGFFRKTIHDQEVEHIQYQEFRSWKLFRQGVLTNVLNPKVALFFLSFLPQFVNPEAKFVVAPFLILGLVFFTTGSIWCMILVFGSSWIGERFRMSQTRGGIIKKLTGTLFIGLGIKLAFSQAE